MAQDGVKHLRCLRLQLTCMVMCGISCSSAVCADVIPNDYYFSDQWALTKMNIPEAWDISMGSLNVKIGVLDSGEAFGTPDIQGRYLTPLVASTGGEDTTSAFVHGTWVTSVIGMTIDNAIGGAGTGNFSILPIRITDDTGLASDSRMIQGINLAAAAGCRVITISYSATSYAAINSAVAQALASNSAAGRGDFLVFMGGGNANTFHSLGSADLDNAQMRLDTDHLIMVGGTDQNDQRWYSSTFKGSDVGPYVDLAAPAAHILVANGTDPDAPYGFVEGTSFSSPYAASAAALAFSINPELSASQVQNMLLDTAFNPNNPHPGTPYWDMTYGWGRVDYQALAVAAHATLVPEASTLAVLSFGAAVCLRRGRRRR